jgi:hypothetical protein
MASTSALPEDLFDQKTIISLFSTLAIVAVAYGTSLRALPASASGAVKFLFTWHAADALVHFILEGSFLYHCFFSWQPAAEVDQLAGLFPTPYNFLGHEDTRVYGAQSGGANPFAQLWTVYARADKRWAGVDLVCLCIATHADETNVLARASSAWSFSPSSSMVLWPCTSATACPSATPRPASG